jgi:hypothetical protein
MHFPLPTYRPSPAVLVQTYRDLPVGRLWPSQAAAPDVLLTAIQCLLSLACSTDNCVPLLTALPAVMGVLTAPSTR